MTQKTNGVATNGHAAVEMYAPDEARGLELRTNRPPAEIMDDAAVVAKLLDDVVTKRGLFTVIGGNRHLKVEAWLTCGTFYGVTAGCTETKPIEIGDDIGWEAHAQAKLTSNGQVISEADGMCATDESRWRERATYKNGRFDGMEPVSHQSRRSMAQTRAVSKCLAFLFRWVAVLAGYEPTPAEEMPEMQGDRDIPQGRGDARSAPARPRNKPGKPLTKAQLAALKPAIVASGWPKEKLAAFIKCPLSELWVRIQTLDKPTYQRLLKALKGEK